jgi:hypothetical protein
MRYHYMIKIKAVAFRTALEVHSPVLYSRFSFEYFNPFFWVSLSSIVVPAESTLELQLDFIDYMRYHSIAQKVC